MITFRLCSHITHHTSHITHSYILWSCEEYERRIEALEKVLDKVTLDDLYKDKSIVGDVLDANYKPEVMLSAGERISRIKDSKVIQDTVKNAIVGKSWKIGSHFLNYY